MVRFLRSLYEEFTTQEELDRFMVAEHLANLLYIPSSILISLSALGKHGIIPYASKYHWRLLIPASVYLIFANTRDLHTCARNFLLPQNAESPTHKTLLGQIQLVASLFMTLGSISLLNACVISIVYVGNDNSNAVGYGHYAVSFGLFVTGSAANTAPLGQKFEEHDASRALLTFQHILSSTFFCLEGFLMLPGLVDKDSLLFRNTLASILAIIASVVLVFSSIVNYFHSLGLLQAYRRFTEQIGNYDDDGISKERFAERGRGLFRRFLGIFGSTLLPIEDHENYDELDFEHPYADEALLTSDSSSISSSRIGILNESHDIDVEEGGHRSDIVERNRYGGRKKKRKGKKR